MGLSPLTDEPTQRVDRSAGTGAFVAALGRAPGPAGERFDAACAVPSPW
jgi:hypothetical protein